MHGSPLEGYAFENCWVDYLKSAVEKIITVIVCLGIDKSNGPTMKWFIENLEAFLTDHKISIDSVGVPRMF
jgi:hypothetical protein